MTQYNTLNVKLSDPQLNELKSEIINDTEVTLKLSSNVIGDCNDEKKFRINYCYLIQKFCKAFANNYSANIKL